MAKNQRRYTDEERASFVVMLQAAGYPDTTGALKRVAAHAGVHENVLRRWWQGTQNPPPTALVTAIKKDLRDAIQDELNDIFAAMKTKREDATYKDLGVVAGIMMDKRQLLNDKPTERIAHEHSGELTIDERRQRIADILNTAGTRRTGSAAGGGTRTDD